MTGLSFTPLFLAGIGATASLLVMEYLTWQYRSRTIGQLAVIMLSCASLYSLFFTLSLQVTDVFTSILLVLLELPLRLTLPVLSFFFILLYIGEIESITPKVISLTCLVPVLVLITAFTPQLTDLFVRNVSPSLVDGRIIFAFIPGPFFWLSHLYSYTLIIACVALVVSRFFRSPPVYRVQITAILLAFVVPSFMHMGLVFMPESTISVVSALAGFVLTAVAVFIATSRFQFLTLTPVAIPILFDKMTDGVIIANIQNLVVEINPAAARILGKERNTLIGMKAETLLPSLPGPESAGMGSSDAQVTITLPRDGQPHYYDIRYIPLGGKDRMPGGTIILLHDSHGRCLTEMGLRRSNEKLQLLTSITRHDILNTLTALMGSLQIARNGAIPKETDRRLVKAEAQTDLLRSQIEFTRDYQTLGLESAQWQYVKDAISPYIPHQDTPRITIGPILADVRVYADPMFGRVFYNLIDNSLRHGGRVTMIRIEGWDTGSEFIITYEDDGSGIPTAEKELVFQKGHGKNTGLGLFLTREILAITGIRIAETGRPGEGVRFEIAVPNGAYRVTPV